MKTLLKSALLLTLALLMSTPALAAKLEWDSPLLAGPQMSSSLSSELTGTMPVACPDGTALTMTLIAKVNVTDAPAAAEPSWLVTVTTTLSPPSDLSTVSTTCALEAQLSVPNMTASVISPKSATTLRVPHTGTELFHDFWITPDQVAK